MPASREKLKIYSTTSAMPSADARNLVGARRSDFGSFQVFVVAPSKIKARAYIAGAFQRGGTTLDDKALTVAAATLDPAAANDSLGTLMRAGLFVDDGDVVVTDRDHHAGVVRIAGAVEADGDPQLVGRWDTARDADDFPVKGFHRADGVVFAEPVDELHKQMVLEDRAEKAAEAKLAAEAPGAVERVEAFLAAREPDENLSNTDTVAVYVGLDGRAELTVADLRTLVAAARKLGSQ